MAPAASQDAESRRRKRELRTQIARQRRRIDRRRHGLAEEASRLRSWRTYVRHFPAAGLAVGFGLGLSLSAGLRSRGWSRWLGRRLVRRGMVLFSQRFSSELKDFWASTRPEREGPFPPMADDPTPSELDES